jgi:c-di-GMP-binding flagellar brake protein YcgR
MNVNENVPLVARKGPPRLSDAVDMIAANADPHEMTDAFDIGEALTQLAESGEPISIYAGRAREPVMARIESVDPELPHFVLDLAGGAAMPTGHALTLVASLGNNAKMQFELPDDWKALPGQSQMVNASFPEMCLVLNRRTERRYETPVGGNYTASFMMLGQKRVLQLYDFSMGGIGMRAAPQQSMGLRVGKKIEGVRLDIGDSTLEVDMVIRLARRFRTFLLGEQVQVGCQFVNVKPETQQALNRIINAHQAPRRHGAHA